MLAIAFLWILLLIYTFYTKQSEDYQAYFRVPKNARTSIEFQSNKILKHVLKKIFLNGEGEQIIQELKESEGNISQPNYGINWLKSISYFESDFEGTPIVGLIVCVSDDRKFNKNAIHLLGENTFTFVQDETGVLLYGADLTQSQYRKYVKALPKNTGNDQFDDLIHYKLKNNGLSIDAVLNIQDNQILIDGKLKHPQKMKQYDLNYVLEPADLHLSGDVFDEVLLDSLNHFFKTDLPVSAFSMNYRGLSLTQLHNQLAFLPDAEMILSFQHDFTVQEFIDQVPHTAYNKAREELVIDNFRYFIKQLDKQTIYLGVSKKPKLLINEEPIGLVMSGGLDPIIQVKSASFLATLMKMHPVYRKLSELIKQIENNETRMSKIGDDTYRFSSMIKYKENTDAQLEILSVVLK